MLIYLLVLDLKIAWYNLNLINKTNQFLNLLFFNKGMRFALLEMKLTLVKLLLKYNVKNTKNTPIELSFVEGTVRRPKNKIPICLEKRKNVYQL